MSSKSPKKGSRGGARTPQTEQPNPRPGETTFNAEVSAFAVSSEGPSYDDDAPASGIKPGVRPPTGPAAPTVKTIGATGPRPTTGPAAPGTTTPPPAVAPGGTGVGATTDATQVNFSSHILSELQNIGTFPALGSSPHTGGGSGSSGAQAPLQRTVEQALQSVLGRLPRGGDHKSFVAALNMSFTYKEGPGGRGGYEWTPRTYIGKTDLGGGVTGAQASLVTFARSAYDNSIGLLDQLYSLVPETDEEEVEASIAIVRSLWTEFVNELGREGGPRAARADSLAQTLLGETVSPPPPTLPPPPTSPADCQLTRLGVLLGVVKTNSVGGALVANGRPEIARNRVVTTEEEANLTSFVSMSDYMYSAQGAWKNYLNNFFQKDLGTGLVLLARLLSVLAETVDEVYSAMDSVYVGPAERLTIRVGVPGKDLSVEELLSWVHTFATEEAPHLIQDGGRRGVEAIIPTATLLKELMGTFFANVRDEADERARRNSAFNEFLDKALGRPPRGTQTVRTAPGTGATVAGTTPPKVLPVGMTQLRVLNPLKDVYRYLDELLTTATNIKRG